MCIDILLRVMAAADIHNELDRLANQYFVALWSGMVTFSYYRPLDPYSDSLQTNTRTIRIM
jgi:hypothetical protein